MLLNKEKFEKELEGFNTTPMVGLKHYRFVLQVLKHNKLKIGNEKLPIILGGIERGDEVTPLSIKVADTERGRLFIEKLGKVKQVTPCELELKWEGDTLYFYGTYDAAEAVMAGTVMCMLVD